MYAHREEFPQHEAAREALKSLAEGPIAWALPVFVIGEFLRVVTHPRILDPPSTRADALAAVDGLLGSPSVRLLSPGPHFWSLLKQSAGDAGATGNLMLDAQIVALCREHGISEIVSEDRDFRRFSGITSRLLTS